MCFQQPRAVPSHASSIVTGRTSIRPGRCRRGLSSELGLRLCGPCGFERWAVGGVVTLGGRRPGPGARSGRVASWSGRPPWRCCALSGWGCRSGGGDAGDNWKGTGQGLVFTTKNGTPIEPRNLNRSFEVLCVRAGVRKVRFHDLRHTCASLLHEQGADACMIMEVLGHSSIRVTMDIYTFVRLDSQRSAFDRVGEVLREDDGNPLDEADQ